MEVSICITTYNHAKYVRQCLESVLNQDFSENFEVIICNDNSSDETEKEILYVQNNHLKGNCIRYFYHKPNLGYVKNTLFSFEKAKGKYISVLDGDDYFIDAAKLQKQYDFLEKNKDFSAVGGDSLVIYEDTDKKEHHFSGHLGQVLSSKDLTDPVIFQTSTFFFRKEILKNGFPNDILSADRCLYLLAGCFGKVKVLPDVLSTYRQFSASLSKNVKYETMKKDFKIIPYIQKNSEKYKTAALKRYFYYTLMSYSTVLTKHQFYKAALGYSFYNICSKFTLNPLKLYSILKWTKHTVTQKYSYKKENHNFV